ncbi:coiled-coil domain-containing protein 50 isoform X1 [Cyclopterus lumpus]|uniref:Coiled-coil domain containing 50a n=1 Tax=Cyclopterus lumpus TaxID=8103 RepID=A0A8C3AW66_CYCLU|nr:coiled-coil domain-containing protein 50 isoform X1 [Cyclopterus lumpus]
MAECDVSIDKNKLPGVKEVCKDFAVLEDHCLAYNLQEQEIESHLASNVNKSRLVQKDLQVAKKLQEEEDERAKGQNQKQHTDIERQDNEIAQEIQDQLVRQAEQQLQQEEKDAAIARKLQEKEMKEEKKRQKQLEANFEEEYFEDHGAARRTLDLDKHTRHPSTSPNRYDAHAQLREDSHRDYSPDYSSIEPKRSRYPKQDPAAPNSRSRNPDRHLVAEGGRSRHADPYPEHLLPSRGKHGDRYPEYEPTETGKVRGPGREDTDRAVRRKDRPARPPPPQSPKEKAWDRKHDRERGRDLEWERHMEKEQRRDREQDLRGARGRDRERSRDRVLSGDGRRERDRQKQKDKDGQRARTRSRERGLEEEPVHSRHCPRDGRASWEEGGADGEGEGRSRGRQRIQSGPEEVFDELDEQGGGHSHPNGETGRIVHRVSGAVIAETAYGVSEATKGLTKLDIREQEHKDMEVARQMQEEEIKASKMHVRTAQVAQDEEIARLMMEQEKKGYRKNREQENEREREREREKEKERERQERERERERQAMERKAMERKAMEKKAMERRRPEGDYRSNAEEVVRPRTRDEYEHQRQRNHNKAAGPPQPRAHDYENVNSGYGYSDHHASPRAPTRPEAAYKGAYQRR